jgi:hypothetical protein
MRSTYSAPVTSASGSLRPRLTYPESVGWGAPRRSSPPGRPASCHWPSSSYGRVLRSVIPPDAGPQRPWCERPGPRVTPPLVARGSPLLFAGMTYVDLAPDDHRPGQVQFDAGRRCDGWLEAYRQVEGVWSGYVRYSTEPGVNYLGWFARMRGQSPLSP